MNAVHDATKDAAVRRTIQLAVERSAILEHYEGTARPTFSLVAQPMAAYDPDLRPEGWDDDVATRQATARKILSDAGLQGHEVTIYYPLQPRPYLPRPQDIADTVRQQLKAVGLDARIQGEDKNKLFPGVPTGQYELILIGWMTDNGDPDNFYGPLADGSDDGPSESNTSRVRHPEVHEKLLAARQLTDAAARVAAYRDIERQLQTDVIGYVPLVNTKQAVAYSKKINGFVIDLFGHYRFDEATLE
jgi:peptide/nickel transport system substrate-binding protein